MICKKCKKEYDNSFHFCPICGNKTDKSPKISTEATLTNIVKVLIVVAVCIIPFFGMIGGIIAGIIFMDNDSEDTKSFGKALIILGIILVLLGILCCVGSLFFNSHSMNSIDKLPHEYNYYFDEFI